MSHTHNRPGECIACREAFLDNHAPNGECEYGIPSDECADCAAILVGNFTVRDGSGIPARIVWIDADGDFVSQNLAASNYDHAHAYARFMSLAYGWVIDSVNLAN